MGANQVDMKFNKLYAYYAGWRIKPNDADESVHRRKNAWGWYNATLGERHQSPYSPENAEHFLAVNIALHRGVDTLISDAMKLGANKVSVYRGDEWIVTIENNSRIATGTHKRMKIAVQIATIIFMMERGAIQEGVLAATEGEASVIDWTVTPDREVNAISFIAPNHRDFASVRREWHNALNADSLLIKGSRGYFDGERVWAISLTVPQEVLLSIAADGMGSFAS